MPAALDVLITALYVCIDDFLEPRRGPGRPPKVSDSELICLAVCQVLLGMPNDRQFLALAHYREVSGSFVEDASPAFWLPRVEAAVAARTPQLMQALATRGRDCDVPRLAAGLAPLLRDTMLAILRELYPDADLTRA